MLALAIVSSGTLAAQSQPSDSRLIEEILQAERDWFRAYSTTDTTALNRLEADEFVLSTPAGSSLREGRYARLAGASADRRRERSELRRELRDPVVNVFGNTAVIRAVNAQGIGEARGRTAYTGTWVRRDGRWQLTTAHYAWPPVDRAAEEAAIRTLVASGAADTGENRTDDRILWTRARVRPTVGKEDPDTWVPGGSPDLYRNLRITYQVRRIDLAKAGDLAYEYSDFNLTRERIADGEKINFDGSLLRVWKKSDGAWKVAASFRFPHNSE